ncbi:MAG: MGMT family protein [Candidatus Omnitrophica bacterium]|nr:MGMT family protein [Candidatus Omnitrophota bacterium]
MNFFTVKVLKIVSKIPVGQVRTYKWVASEAGNPRAARAVGQIMKNNPYPLIIPCHRVVRSNKEIGGYAFGKNYKKLLLELERNVKCLLSRK